jgi:hypothetical protein
MPSDLCRNILLHVKERYEYERDTLPAKLTDISCQVYPYFATGRLCWYLPKNYGRWIRNDSNSNSEAQQVRKWSQCMGRFVRYHPVTVTRLLPPKLVLSRLRVVP